MKQIREYLSTHIIKLGTIIADNDSIKKIVNSELNKFGYDADLNHIDVSKVTDMDNLFGSLDLTLRLNINPDISKWDVSNVTDMRYMFSWCYKFNCDIGDWTPDNVIFTNSMFDHCKSFNQDLSRWHLRNARIIDDMFTMCPIEEKYKPNFKK